MNTQFNAYGPSWSNVSNSSASFVIGSGLPSTQAVYYDRLAVKALFAHLGFQDLTAERSIPMKSGKTTQIFTPNLSPYNSVGASAADTPPSQATEGTVGTPLVPAESKITAVLGQYVDYTNISDFA